MASNFLTNRTSRSPYTFHYFLRTSKTCTRTDRGSDQQVDLALIQGPVAAIAHFCVIHFDGVIQVPSTSETEFTD